MEMVDIVATSNFINSQVGSVSRKQRLRVPRPLAEEFLNLGLVQLNPLVTVCRNQPLLAGPLGAGGDKLSVLSPAAPALPKKTAILLQAAPTGAASQSTTLGDACPAPMSFGPAMERGGMSTTAKSKPSLPVKRGRKTKVPAGVINSSGLAASMSPA